MSDLWYAYAVCRPFGTPLESGLTGVAGAPPRLVREGDLVAVAGEVPERDFSQAALHARLEDLDLLAATARAHDRVVAGLARETSPLPLRLATVFESEQGVREMLRARHGELRALLQTLDGRVEWGVKVYAEPAAAGPGGPGERDAGGEGVRAASGRDYLRRRRAERDGRENAWQRAEEFAARLRRALAPCAAAERLHRPQSPELSGASGRNVLNVAYLVDRARAEEFTAGVRHAADGAEGLRVELTGPWAAYSFTGQAPDAAGGAGQGGAVLPAPRAAQPERAVREQP